MSGRVDSAECLSNGGCQPPIDSSAVTRQTVPAAVEYSRLNLERSSDTSGKSLRAIQRGRRWFVNEEGLTSFTATCDSRTARFGGLRGL